VNFTFLSNYQLVSQFLSNQDPDYGVAKMLVAVTIS